MMLQEKIWIILGYTLIVFGISWHIHDKFDDAAKVKAMNVALDKSQKAQNNIVKFNQELRKVKTTDACFNTVIPADVNKLLQQ